MRCDGEMIKLGDLARNASRSFNFKEHDEVVFVNTGDVHEGKFLHNNKSSKQFLPGQAKKAIKKNDILLSEIRPANRRFAYVTQDAPYHVVSTKFMVIEATGKASAEYLFTLLTSNTVLRDFQLIAETRSGTFPQITFDAIAHYELYVPSANQQKAVVNVIGVLNKKIDLLKETNTTLEAIAQAIFKSWFIDFDPVRAKQQKVECAGIDKTTADLFPSSFVQSELGLIPEGWRTTTLSEILRAKNTQVKKDTFTKNTKYVGLEHIPRKSLSLSEWSYAESVESNKAVFTEDDVLFGKLRPYFHKVVIAPFCGVCSTDILVCNSSEEDYYGLIVMHLFSDALIEYSDRLSNGAKMPRIGVKDINGYKIVIPPKSAARAYSQLVKPIFTKLKSNVYTAQTLASLRNTLLPRLMSGKLNLSEIEEQLEGVA